MGPNSTRVGVINYASAVKNEFSLKTYQTKAGLLQAVRRIEPLSTGTMTGLAIQFAISRAFSDSEGARVRSPNFNKVRKLSVSQTLILSCDLSWSGWKNQKRMKGDFLCALSVWGQVGVNCQSWQTFRGWKPPNSPGKQSSAFIWAELARSCQGKFTPVSRALLSAWSLSCGTQLPAPGAPAGTYFCEMMISARFDGHEQPLFSRNFVIKMLWNPPQQKARHLLKVPFDRPLAAADITSSAVSVSSAALPLFRRLANGGVLRSGYTLQLHRLC